MIVHLRKAAFAIAAMVTTLVGPSLVGHAPALAQLDTQNLVPCAQDGQVCRMPHPTNVYYGVQGRTNGRPFPQGGVVACNAKTFGDPAPGAGNKMCWYAPKMAEGRRGGGRSRGDEDESGYRSRDRDGGYDRPQRRSSDDYDRPRGYRRESDY